MELSGDYNPLKRRGPSHVQIIKNNKYPEFGLEINAA